ncbi:MAG TPA: RidA family protein [Candidatus Binataceae bacterium]|nr:RidA family protein [Candidatus Binataceae bacterium]
MASRRKSIHLEGFSHGTNPIPYASVVDNILMSGGINGHGADGKVPADPTEQVHNMFNNIRRMMDKAGGTLEDIVKITVNLSPKVDRNLINGPWSEMFPDAESRPARKTNFGELGGNMICQCEVTAVLKK